MDRLTKQNADGSVTLAEGRTVPEALERLAGYENAHAFLQEEARRAEARLDALRGQGRARTAAFQQALTEKLHLSALLERLEKPPRGRQMKSYESAKE